MVGVAGGRAASDKPRSGIDDHRGGPLAPYLAGAATLIEVLGDDPAEPAGTAALVFAAHRLEFAADYRSALRRWFAAVEPDGHLVLVVSHAFLAERRLALPSRRWPGQRRLYTPRALLDEVEEALAPNSYRVRLLADDDRGYDYAAPFDAEPKGRGDVVLVLQKMVAPDWPLADPPPVLATTTIPREPDFAFVPPRSRIEVAATAPRRRILILKLDHLGDFIISIAALRRARAAFPEAEITLVVGSWNAGVARDLEVADHVVAFDAFPRNSTEEEADPRGAVALFRETVSGDYDIAIDLRTDHDTRILLRDVRATLKAGIGSRGRFPFLDIFLPIDGTRNEPEMAGELRFSHHDFPSQGSAGRTAFRIFSAAATAERGCAIVWGPYRWLRSGRYFFEPQVEIVGNAEGGVVLLDIAVDARRLTHAYLPGGDPRLWFDVDGDGGAFEFRIWTVDGAPSLDLNFYGGRLIRAGADGVLHQSEYQSLLIELVRMRTEDGGMLADAAV